MSLTGTAVLAAVVVVVLAAGLLLRARSGRVRAAAGNDGPSGWDLAGAPPSDGERVLLLQLSAPVCAPCRQTATVLERLAASDPGLRHVEIDVGDRIDVARTLGVLRTPTTVAFDRDGRELLRISGVPRPAELTDALARG